VFNAQFLQPGADSGCTGTTSGACTYFSCSSSTTPVGLSAGTLVISGGSIPTSVTISPDADNMYSYEAQGALFTAGQTLSVSASGATVPAFGPVSLVAPGLPILVSPANVGGTYTIPTSVDLAVAWSGGEAGAVMMLEGTLQGSLNYFECEWDASAGAGVVPQAVLAGLAGQSSAVLIYGQSTATSFTAGGYSVTEAALPFSGGTASFE
jgi:hypothetical protein